MRLYLDKIISPVFESSLHSNINKNMDKVDRHFINVLFGYIYFYHSKILKSKIFVIRNDQCDYFT